MRWLLPILFLFALTSCVRSNDTLSPLLSVVQPQGGVFKDRKVRVVGYAMDDTGLSSVRVKSNIQKETELLPEKERGDKLYQFSFIVNTPQSGQVELTITATDLSGRSREMKLPLVLDARQPQIRLERTEPIVEYTTRTVAPPPGSENQEPIVERTPVNKGIRITGRALDDTGVDKVVVQYQQGGKTLYNTLSLPKGKEVPFYVEVPVRSATIIAVDAAGNRISVQAR
ncbi:hypothetical protein Mterra_00113 [Calidithermus terrae]|uniref:Lipoprotein n=1 Tax=Calidithermus terrae TaxID=1408545 RepID=A0A399F3X1_9DEIN|nr:hypothetical protein Mterra_00113 [Calidithermus terrae]